jgi:hypothetical protein
MKKIMRDPDNDQTNKHILVRHEGEMYFELVHALDLLEEAAVDHMKALLEGA